MAFGFGNLGMLQQRLAPIGNDSLTMDDMSGGQIAKAKAFMPVAAKPPAAAPGGSGAPASTADQVQTGLPTTGGSDAAAGAGGGSGLSSLFDELFGGGDATMMIAG